MEISDSTRPIHNACQTTALCGPTKYLQILTTTATSVCPSATDVTRRLFHTPNTQAMLPT